jgi:hypothetical protein
MQTGVLGLVGIMELMWTTNILQRIFVGRELPGRQIHSDPDADVVVKNVAGSLLSRRVGSVRRAHGDPCMQGTRCLHISLRLPSLVGVM